MRNDINDAGLIAKREIERKNEEDSEINKSYSYVSGLVKGCKRAVRRGINC